MGKRFGILALLSVALALPACGGSLATVTAESSRATGCVEAERAIIDRCDPGPDGNSCRNPEVTIEQTRQHVDCIRQACDRAREELTE